MSSILNGLSAAAFVRRHWQKRPLLIRQALPGFRGIVDRDRLFALATRPEATSRLVIHHPRRRGQRWERHDGPFGAIDASMVPATHWTLLVHGVESLLPGGWELLRQFSFLPAARVDDLMISYAAPGGTVGPHDDLYDVFLLQGPGRRRWQISTGGDRRVDPTTAIKVLQSFVPDEEWLLDPGDMLYLPPGVAHHGVAEDACFTYSIGFLAPSHAELTQSFLEYLGAVLGAKADPDARYRDPDLTPPRDPLEVSDQMLARVSAVLRGIRWSPALFADFLGRFLTQPRPRARFSPPARPLPPGDFARRLRGRGWLRLALPTRGLTRRGRVFFNGAAHTPARAWLPLLRQLLHQRAFRLPLPRAATGGGAHDTHNTIDTLHDFYLAGYLTLGR